MKTGQELKAVREAHKRLSWIDNVKRIYGWDQERAEKEWAKIFNSETTTPINRTDKPGAQDESTTE